MDIRQVFKMLAGLILMVSSHLLSQQESNSFIQQSKTGTDTVITRKVFVFASIGILEDLSLGAGYQVSTDFAISIKASDTWIGSGWIFPNDGYGVGVKLSYFHPFSIFNCVNFEYISYLGLSFPNGINSITKGSFYDINIGKEVITNEGLRVFWSIGLAVSDAKASTTVLSPSIKIGLNYNLFQDKGKK